ncbi:MAG: hypothetical protein U0V54_05910 [Saprospiraceae bacterium]
MKVIRFVLDGHITGRGCFLGKIFLYRGSCGDLFCIDTFELGSNVHPSFYAASEGSDFKIQIVLQGAGNSAAIHRTCRNYNDNNTCEKAEEITCGETVIGNTWLATIHPMAATQQDKHFIIPSQEMATVASEFEIRKGSI